MKYFKSFISTLGILFFSCPSLCALNTDSNEPISTVINRGLDVSTRQSILLAEKLENEEGRLPRSFENDKLLTSDFRSWISGFFPGVLWYLYENNPQLNMKKYAELYTARVEPAKNMTSTHDLGFMLYCSFGNGYRLTGNKEYLKVLETGAWSLASRYDNKTRAIKSWNSNAKWQYPVIIDNMMNLEFLSFITKETNEERFLDIANKHAQTTLVNHFRADNSCYHVISYDTITGRPHAKQTHQGYADESAWARGQAWALYGYTMMYRETGRPEYLTQARKVAFFILNHPNLPTDKVPYWDFNAPDIPNAPRDASAAAVMASALIELSQLDKSKDSFKWLQFAEEQIRSLSSPAYLAEVGTNGNFILKHSVGNLNKKSEVDTPLTYADYYYVEALLRLKKLQIPPVLLKGSEDRAYWVQTLTKIAHPILANLSQGTLKKNMPFESLSENQFRKDVSYLEAVGRTICGIAPWLELGTDNTEEGKLRSKYIEMTIQGLKNVVNPQSPDYLVFDNRISQPLVDAAFLAEGLLRAPQQLWGNLDVVTQSRVITELKRTRSIKPNETNWLLFASTVEAALLEFTSECDSTRLHYGVNRFLDEWYKGDAWYGDGKELHLDYYNSLVIHPMLTDVLTVLQKHGMTSSKRLNQQLLRHKRFAEELERFISPEASFPVIGRSIVYRTGVFHALSQAALIDNLPEKLAGSQIRSALTAVIKRQFADASNFDTNGWLRIGFTSSQINMSEEYINTGSLYLCTAVMLPLGLPAGHPFWTGPYMEWTNAKAWKGIDVGCDKALRGK